MDLAGGPQLGLHRKRSRIDLEANLDTSESDEELSRKRKELGHVLPIFLGFPE